MEAQRLGRLYDRRRGTVEVYRADDRTTGGWLRTGCLLTLLAAPQPTGPLGPRLGLWSRWTVLLVDDGPPLTPAAA